VALLAEIRASAPDSFQWRAGAFDRLAGTDRLRRSIEEGEPVERIFTVWEEDLARFRARRLEYLLYE